MTAETVRDYAGNSAERLAPYDWDGDLRAGCAAIAAAIAGHERDIVETFWAHYLTIPASAPVRRALDATAVERQKQQSVEYIRSKYARIDKSAWMRMGCRHARQSHRLGVPLSAQFAGLSFAHCATIKAVATHVGDDRAEFERLSDIIQRVALIEADLLSSHIHSVQRDTAEAVRGQRMATFRQSIAGSIEQVALQGSQIRDQAGETSSATRGMLGKTSEVAAAAEQSAVAMREAAQTAAGLIRA
ncbi:MAG: protoglobin domain-containing protein, partial [Pseudomonadota bacterium]|nr:protoglobin domain-containing protein [Pseudomonadota bacterium]